MMKKESKIILICVLALILIGFLMIYSASSIWAGYIYNDSFHFLKLQIIYFFISFIFFLLLQKVNPEIYYKKANLFLLICFILLILVLIPGIGTLKNGSRSWFSLGIISMQPSEFAKISLIIFTSKYLSNNEKDIKSFKKGLFPILLIIFTFFFLILLEPDFGSGMVMVLSLIILIFASGTNLSFFTGLGILGLIGITFLIIIAPYRISRILSFINPWSDPLGSGYQIIQSLYAIGPGGLFGLGFGKSIQKQFYLPEPQTDFIFAIICEEFGFFGASAIVIIFGILFYNVCKLSMKESNLFKKYLMLGLGILVTFQALLNLCVVVGLIPVTGVTLPFISYGGSSLLTSMISMGIILSVSKDKK